MATTITHTVTPINMPIHTGTDIIAARTAAAIARSRMNTRLAIARHMDAN